MNLVRLLARTTLIKKQVYMVMALVVTIVCLPVMAVFGLGQSALSILSLGSLSGTQDALYQGPTSATDLYEYGNCTYWASLLRQQAHKSIPNTWGNANIWATRALFDGYVVDHIPTVTAIMQTSAGSLGHVAYVTAVDESQGTWTISEMNVKGLDIVDIRTLIRSAANQYSFIHDSR